MYARERPAQEKIWVLEFFFSVALGFVFFFFSGTKWQSFERVN